MPDEKELDTGELDTGELDTGEEDGIEEEGEGEEEEEDTQLPESASDDGSIAVAEKKNDAPPESKPALRELKIVLNMKSSSETHGSYATIGISSPNCDPVFRKLTGTMTEIMASVEGFAAEAVTKWETQQRNPKCSIPLPSQSTPSSTRIPPAPAKPPTAQKPLF